ncbi:hypothetical protein Tco_1492813 [Tanacetum coccineum]
MEENQLDDVMEVIKQIDLNKNVVEDDNDLESKKEDVMEEDADLEAVAEEMTGKIICDFALWLFHYS